MKLIHVFIVTILSITLFSGCVTTSEVEEDISYQFDEHNCELYQKVPNSYKNELKQLLFSDYGGKQWLSRTAFKKIETYGDLDKYFEKYLKGKDAHFKMTLKCKCGKEHISYKKYVTQIFDAPNVKSEDIDVREYISTSNAEYVRVSTRCADYDEVFKKVKGNKDFLILDFRTNCGGGNTPVCDCLRMLLSKNWHGTIICLEDNYSYSAAELPEIFEYSSFANRFKYKVVGTSGGCDVMWDNHGHWIQNTIYLYFGTKTGYDVGLILSGFKEGRGFKTKYEVRSLYDYIKHLKAFGVDTTGIIIR